jgi:hypothetical protein
MSFPTPVVIWIWHDAGLPAARFGTKAHDGRPLHLDGRDGLVDLRAVGGADDLVRRNAGERGERLPTRSVHESRSAWA